MISTNVHHNSNPFIIGIIISIIMFFITLTARYFYFSTLDFPFAIIMTVVFYLIYSVFQFSLSRHMRKSRNGSNPVIVGVIISLAMFLVILFIRFSILGIIDIPLSLILALLIFFIYILFKILVESHILKRIQG